MSTASAPPRPAQQLAEPRLGWLGRPDVQRFEVAWLTAFHLLVAAGMLLAPRSQIIGPSTSAIFGFIPLPVWVVWFTLAALVAAVAVHRFTPARLAATWTAVLPLAAAWIVGFAFGVGDGRGNVLGLIVWISHLVWWLTLAARLYLGGPEARWGGA